MPNLLKTNLIEAVGFVDAGANPDSDILIWKRGVADPTSVQPEKGEGKMPFDINSLPEEAQTEFQSLESRIAELEEAATTNATELEVAQKAAAEAVSNADGGTDGGDPVLKKLDDEVREQVEKRIAEAEKRADEALAKADVERKERLIAKCEAEAKDNYSRIPGDDVAKGKVLYEIDENLSEDTAKGLREMLSAANGLIEAGGITEEIGKGGGDKTQTNWDSLVAKANDLVSKGEFETREQAIDHIYSTEPDLIVAARADA